LAATAIERLQRHGAVYERLGVTPIINANGTQTVLGGSIMEPEVVQAMAEAAGAMVRLKDLNDRAGEIIAKHTGAEAGLVTAGGAAGLMLQMAACIAGTDRDKIKRLPDSAGIKSEFVIKRNHDSEFVQAWRQAGGAPVWVGTRDGAAADELEAAIGENTVALAFIASRWHSDSFNGLDEMIDVGRRHSVPVIVDAAAMLPPPENLRRFIEHGADMVCFSGGKAIKGPQSAGVLCGRKYLMEAAALNSSPNEAVGRPAKVCKEEIVGLVTALERYVRRDHSADQRRWRGYCETIAGAIDDLPRVSTSVEQDDWLRPVPELSVVLGAEWRGPSASEIVLTMAEGAPPIMIEDSRRVGEDIFANPHGLLPGEAEVVGERLRAAMTSN